jgi:hypothetical protein
MLQKRSKANPTGPLHQAKALNAKRVDCESIELLHCSRLIQVAGQSGGIFSHSSGFG